MIFSAGTVLPDALQRELEPAIDVGLYHHEQHMAKVDHQHRIDYDTIRPATVGVKDGVPIVWVYIRSGRALGPAHHPPM